jgi:hypothetical protein
VLRVVGEAGLVYNDRPISCLLTIGTGIAPEALIPQGGIAWSALGTAEAVLASLTSGEHAHLDAQPLFEP